MEPPDNIWYYSFMFDAFLAQLLILFLLTLACIRIFIIRTAKVDTAVILTPVALFLSLLQFFAWGIDIQSILITILAALIFFTNVNALMRLWSHLYVDHYSGLFTAFTIFELILTLLLTGTTIWMRPVRCTPGDFTVIKTYQLLTGSFSAGFKTSEQKTVTPSGIVYTFQSQNPGITTKKQTPLILFASGPNATTAQYEPYFLFLAQKGYTVMAADFYAKDMHWFSSVVDTRIFRRGYALFLTLKAPDKYKSHQKNFDANIQKEYIALAHFIRNEYGPEATFFIVGDEMNSNTVLSIINKFPKNTAGFFLLNTLPEYTTAGYGFIEQTDPWFGNIIGVNRDPSCFIPRYAANKTIDQLQKKQSGN